MNTRIISAFPGTGKTYLYKNQEEYGIAVMDSDSSNFSKSVLFPHNYIGHIRENIGKVDVILISSHDIVRLTLKQIGLPYEIVYPDKSDKGLYLSRYIERGSPEPLIRKISCYWDIFLDEIEADTFPTHHKLRSNGYLSDLF